MWNLTKEGGWERYYLLTEEYSKVFEKIVEDKETSVEEKNDKI